MIIVMASNKIMNGYFIQTNEAQFAFKLAEQVPLEGIVLV